MKLSKLSILLTAQTVNAAGVSADAEIKKISDTCTSSVPCFSSTDSKWYCAVSTVKSGAKVDGSSGSKVAGQDCTTQVGNGLLMSGQTCQAELKSCELKSAADSTKKANLCVGPGTTDAKTESKTKIKTMATTQTTDSTDYETPATGCYKVSTNSEAKYVGDYCGSGEAPCKSGSKWYCAATTVKKDSAVDGGSNNAANDCDKQAANGVVGTNQTCISDFKKCALTDGTTTINVCVDPSDTNAIASNQAGVKIFAITTTTYKTPTETKGCFTVASAGEVTNMGDVCKTANDVPCQAATTNKWHCANKDLLASGTTKVDGSRLPKQDCKTQVAGGLVVTGNSCSPELKQCELANTTTTSTKINICVDPTDAQAKTSGGKPNVLGVSQTTWTSPATSKSCYTITDTTEFKNIGDECTGTGSVPCLADDNKWYCAATTKGTTNYIDGSSSGTGKAKQACTTQTVGGVVGTGQTCASGLRQCELTHKTATSNKLNICVSPTDTKATTTKGTPDIMGITQSVWEAPNVTKGCFGLADTKQVLYTQDVCTTSGSVPCLADDNKWYCAATTKGTTNYIDGSSSGTGKAKQACSSQTQGGVVFTGQTCASGLKSCALKPSSGSNINVCVKSDDTKATTQNTGKPDIFGLTQTAYTTPNLANGCFGVADEDVVDTSIGDKCVTSTALPCEVTDSAGGAGNKATVCAPYTAPYKATNSPLASPATKNVGKYTPNLTGGCFGVKDYIMADTTKNQVCGVSGSYTCQLIKNDGTRESTCVPKTVEGRGGLVGSSKANYYFPANGCWNVEDYAVIDSTYQKCLGYASKECTSSGTKKICVPPTFNGQKVAIPSGPAKAETSPDVVGGCWSVADWKAAGMWDVCAVATSIKCSLTKASVPNATFCVPKTFTAKAKKVDNTAEPFKAEGATAAEAYVSPAAGCFPSAGGAAQLLAGAAAAASVLFTLY